LSQFEYVSVAVALIYALVVGRLLTGLAVGLEDGRRYPIHAAWVAALLLICVAQWWTIWRTRDVEWSALRFLWILIPPSLMYVRAIVLVGLEPLRIESYRDRFFERRVAFFSLFFCDVMVVALGPWIMGIVPWLSAAPMHPGAGALAVLAVAGLVFTSPAAHAGIVGVIFVLGVWNLILLPPIPPAA
jgi:hypothetical protein